MMFTKIKVFYYRMTNRRLIQIEFQSTYKNMLDAHFDMYEQARNRWPSTYEVIFPRFDSELNSIVDFIPIDIEYKKTNTGCMISFVISKEKAFDLALYIDRSILELKIL